MFKNKDDKKDKKINFQQNIIDELNKEIESLKSEYELLKTELEFEKNKPRKGYEKAKQMIIELEEKKHEYQMLIDELNVLKVSYNEKIQELSELKETYKKKMNTSFKKTKKVLKKVKK